MMDKAVSVEEDEQWDESGEEDEEEAGVDNPATAEENCEDVASHISVE